MFEWFYAFWHWLSKTVNSGKFFEPYMNMEGWFFVIVIIFVLSYTLLYINYHHQNHRFWKWYSWQ